MTGIDAPSYLNTIDSTMHKRRHIGIFYVDLLHIHVSRIQTLKEHTRWLLHGQLPSWGQLHLPCSRPAQSGALAATTQPCTPQAEEMMLLT